MTTARRCAVKHELTGIQLNKCEIEITFGWLLDEWTNIICKGTALPIKKTFQFPRCIFGEHRNVVRNTLIAK